MRLHQAMFMTAVLALIPFCSRESLADNPGDQKLEFKPAAVIEEKLKRLYSNQDLPNEKLERRARELGFESLAQLKSAQVDSQNRLPVYYVRLDDLRAYDGTDPWPLLSQTNTYIYPIVVPQKEGLVPSAALVRSDVDKTGTEVSASFSQLGANFAIPSRVLSEARKPLLARYHHCDFFVISIPALKKRFLGGHRGNTCAFMIIDVDLDRGLEHALKALNDASLQPAKDIFMALTKEANSNKYDMPREHNDSSIHE